MTGKKATRGTATRRSGGKRASPAPKRGTAKRGTAKRGTAAARSRSENATGRSAGDGAVARSGQGGPARDRALRARGQRTMRRLLDAGVVVLRQRGYQAARVDDIVKAAETSHGTFYLYFANKEDLFRALAEDVADAMVDLAESLGPVGPDRDGFGELRQWMGRFADLYRRHRAVIQAWTEAETGATEFGRLGTELMTRFTQVLIDRIDRTSVVDVDPQIAALALVAMIERFNYYLLSRQTPVTRDQMLDTLTTIAHLGLFGGRRPSARAARPARAAPARAASAR